MDLSWNELTHKERIALIVGDPQSRLRQLLDQVQAERGTDEACMAWTLEAAKLAGLADPNLGPYSIEELARIAGFKKGALGDYNVSDPGTPAA